jgi:hypothetical protein
VTFAPAGFTIAPDPDDTDADLVVTGDVADLYVMLWNRRDRSGIQLEGETDLLDLWQETVRISWS